MSIKKTKTFVITLAFLCTSSVFADNNKQVTNNGSNDGSIKIVEETVGIKPNTGSLIESLYKEAVAWLKTPYRYGGKSRKGIDCSGFTGTIYENVFGIKLNRSSRDIAAQDVKELKRDELKPGDLVFFGTSRKKKGVSHVGIFLGNDHFVHASTHKGVIISSLDEPYYKRTFLKGGEVKDIDPDLLEKSFFSPDLLENRPLMVRASENSQTVTPSVETLLLSNPILNQTF